MSVRTYLDCGCAILTDGSRHLCPSCQGEDCEIAAAYADAQCDQEEAEESGDLEDRLDAAFAVDDAEQRRRAAHALATEM